MKKVKLILMNPYKNVNVYEHRPMQEAQFFKNIGCDVETLILQRDVNGNEVFQNQIEGVPVKHYLCKTKKMEHLLQHNFWIKKLKPFIHTWWFVSFVYWLRCELHHEEKSYLFAHNIEMAFAMILACKKNDRKIFVMREVYEGQGYGNFKKKIIKVLNEYIQNRSDYLVHVVPFQKSITKKKNRDKIVYVPNYPQKQQYANVKRTKSDKLRINYIGAVRDKKSLKMLMDAVKDLPNVEVNIHGVGGASEYLHLIENEYKNVNITGYYDYQKDTIKLFSETDIIYCAYDISVENWRIAYPIKMYEAFAANIPVILCAGMAPENLVKENGFGFVFDYNVESLRACIQKLLDDENLYDNAVRTIKNSEQKYYWENVVKEYEKIILD